MITLTTAVAAAPGYVALDHPFGVPAEERWTSQSQYLAGFVNDSTC